MFIRRKLIQCKQKNAFLGLLIWGPSYGSVVLNRNEMQFGRIVHQVNRLPLTESELI